MHFFAIVHPAASLAALGEWRPFLTPLPVWDYWAAWLIPLCFAVAVIYKSLNVERNRDLPRAAAIATAWILFGFAAAAGILMAVVWLSAR